MLESAEEPRRYLVDHEGKVKGPLDLQLIEAFVLCGHYPQDLKICPDQPGEREWTTRDLVTGVTAGQQNVNPAGQTSQSKPGNTPKVSGWLVSVIVGIGLLIVVAVSNNNTSSVGRSGSSVSSQSANGPSEPMSAYRPYTAVPRGKPSVVVYTTSDGKRFEVPLDAANQLKSDQELIANQSAAIQALQSQLNADAARIENDRTTLDTSSQYAVERFNERVATYSETRDQLQERIRLYNNKISDLDWEIRTKGTETP